MAGLLRDWLLDPAALLFLFSIAVGLWLVRGARKRAQRDNPIASENLRLGAKKAGFGTSRSWSVAAIIVWLSYYALSTSPVLVNALIAMQEQPYVNIQACEPGSHLVVLGGGVDSRAQSATDYYRMRPATFVRASSAAGIALNEPELRVIVAGGALRNIAEADVIAEYLAALGVSKSRVLREARSSNTYENAVNVAQLLTSESVTGDVRLVTSALHMHRALRTFERVFEGTGLTLCPVSTDIQGLLDPPAYAWMPQTTSLIKFDLLLHEAVALVAYRLRGWI